MNAGTCWGKNAIGLRGRSVEKAPGSDFTFTLQGDLGGNFSILGDDWIGICEIKSSYVHVCSANDYQKRYV
jgi:hypothetical protein